MNYSDTDSCVIENRYIVDAIRRHEIYDIKSVSSRVGMSWPTTKTAVDSLSNNNVIKTEENSLGKKYYINNECMYFLGIAIGASETKITLVDANFDSVSLKDKFNPFYEDINSIVDSTNNSNDDSYFCFRTDLEYMNIYNSCTAIIESAMKHLINDNVAHIVSIGISTPGIIDINTEEITFCPNIPSLVGIPVKKLVSSDAIAKLNDKGIKCYFFHDTVAATVCEKEYLYKSKSELSSKKNIAVLYQGYGFGSGYIINDMLFQGTSGAAGEIGHVDEYFEDVGDLNSESFPNENKDSENKDSGIDAESSSCLCGNSSCLENLIRVKVFDSNNIDKFISVTNENTLKNFAKEYPRRYKAYKQLLGKALSIVVNILNVDVIVLSGRVLNGIPELKCDFEAMVNSHSLRASSKYCSIINGSQRKDVVAIGAAILSYYAWVNQCSDCKSLSIEWN